MLIAMRNVDGEIEALRATLRVLRGKNGCPWDREQSLDDLVSYLIDESYELLHAVKSTDPAQLEEELGDVIFLVVFIHELMQQRTTTPLNKIIHDAHAKIIARHPHVFGRTSAADRTESLAEWERIKKEQNPVTAGNSVLSSIPAVYPPVRKASAIQKKAALTGFDWPDHEGIIDKLYEEIDELKASIDTGERGSIKEEIGDLFFTLINLARQLQVDAEGALDRTTAKFIQRFRWMEKTARDSGLHLEELSLEEQEKLWQKSKNEEPDTGEE
ncbi:MAG: nucleoside triphosphate pyrophosphohydrolase [Candidatus Krumholzibacteriota bacterium]|nr:nucleoside triphosphate pyrophosphohydrolase [Candidatus Krumholzibacteriota bacterium]